MVFLLKKKYRYLIGCIDNDDCYTIKPYVKNYDGETKWMSRLIADDVLLKKYQGIWDKVRNSMKKGLNCKAIYNKKFLKPK